MSSSESSSISQSCILNPNTYCVTESIENSSFTIIFPNSFLNITGFTFWSAGYSDRAAYNFDIYSLTQYEHQWKRICKISVDENYFATMNYAECLSPNYTQGFKFIQRGFNSGSSFQFAVRFLDFFGDLVQIKPSYITFCTHRFHINFHILLLSFLNK